MYMYILRPFLLPKDSDMKILGDSNDQHCQQKAKQVNFYKAQVNCNLVSKDKFYSHDWLHTEYCDQELKDADIPNAYNFYITNFFWQFHILCRVASIEYLQPIRPLSPTGVFPHPFQAPLCLRIELIQLQGGALDYGGLLSIDRDFSHHRRVCKDPN